MNGIIITLMICVTIILISLINKGDKQWTKYI